MSSFSIQAKFWTGETGRNIKLCGKDAQLLALHLLTNPSANNIGLYYFSIEQAVRTMALTYAEAVSAMAFLVEINFCSYNDESGMVFVKNMVNYQYGFNLGITDNRVRGIHNQVRQYPANEPLVKEFLSLYSLNLHFPKEGQPILPKTSEQEFRFTLNKAILDGSDVFDKYKYNTTEPKISTLFALGVTVDEIVQTAKFTVRKDGLNLIEPLHAYNVVINARKRANVALIEATGTVRPTFNQAKLGRFMEPESFAVKTADLQPLVINNGGRGRNITEV